MVTGIAQKSNIASFPLWSFKKKWCALINKVKNHIDRKVYNNNLKKELLIGLLIRIQQDESPLQPCSGMFFTLCQIYCHNESGLCHFSPVSYHFDCSFEP